MAHAPHANQKDAANARWWRKRAQWRVKRRPTSERCVTEVCAQKAKKCMGKRDNRGGAPQTRRRGERISRYRICARRVVFKNSDGHATAANARTRAQAAAAAGYARRRPAVDVEGGDAEGAWRA